MVARDKFPKWTLDVRGNVDRDDNDDEHFKGADSTTQSFARENTQNISDVLVRLPLFSDLNQSDVSRVLEVLLEFGG